MQKKTPEHEASGYREHKALLCKHEQTRSAKATRHSLNTDKPTSALRQEAARVSAQSEFISKQRQDQTRACRHVSAAPLKGKVVQLMGP
jgi:hypothetical protein